MVRFVFCIIFALCSVSQSFAATNGPRPSENELEALTLSCLQIFASQRKDPNLERMGFQLTKENNRFLKYQRNEKIVYSNGSSAVLRTKLEFQRYLDRGPIPYRYCEFEGFYGLKAKKAEEIFTSVLKKEGFKLRPRQKRGEIDMWIKNDLYLDLSVQVFRTTPDDVAIFRIANWPPK